MAITLEELTEVLLQAGPHFTIEVPRGDGYVDVYRGHDVTAFIQSHDSRQHEHKVFDSDGQLVYHRDVNGRVYVGSSRQIQQYLLRKKAGKVAVNGFQMLADAWRMALRVWR